MGILVCAATRSEHGAVLKGIEAAGVKGFEMLLSGVGPLHAARTLRERLEHGSLPDLIVSAGLAGALSSELTMSSWITASRVVSWDGRERGEVEGLVLAEAPAGISRCELVSSSALVTDPASIPPPPAGADDKSALPRAVDMETAALGREAVRRGVQVLVLRMISDTPAEPLPAFLSPFAAAMASEDTRSRMKHAGRGLRGVLSNPRGVARILREGPAWNRKLTEGFCRYAAEIRASR